METRDRTLDRGSYELMNNMGCNNASDGDWADTEEGLPSVAAREYWKNKEDKVEEVVINKVQLTNAWKYSGLVGVLSSLGWYYRDAVARLLKVAVQ